MLTLKKIVWVLLVIWVTTQPVFGAEAWLPSLICSVNESFDCGPGSECSQGSAESIGFPKFIEIKLEESMIRSMTGEEPVRKSEIKSSSRIDGRAILQGVQEGKA